MPLKAVDLVVILPPKAGVQLGYGEFDHERRAKFPKVRSKALVFFFAAELR
jgi:hypothetical protein